MSFFVALRRRCCTFLLGSFVCKIKCVTPSFFSNCQIAVRMKGLQVWTKCLPFNSVLSVVFCWCYCHRRPHQEHPRSKRNGKVFMYKSLLISITTASVVKCTRSWCAHSHCCQTMISVAWSEYLGSICIVPELVAYWLHLLHPVADGTTVHHCEATKLI